MSVSRSRLREAAQLSTRRTAKLFQIPVNKIEWLAAVLISALGGGVTSVADGIVTVLTSADGSTIDVTSPAVIKRVAIMFALGFFSSLATYLKRPIGTAPPEDPNARK